MTVLLRTILLVVVVLYFFFIISLIKKGRIALKYGLLWMFSGVVMLVFAIFPQILIFGTKMLGIEVASNGLFILCIGLIILILVSLTVIVSDFSRRNKELIQKIALMEKRLRDLEDMEHKC